jgi:urease accessory protein UreE
MLSRLIQWFRTRPPARDPAPARPQIAWHGEQDGPAEREFKVRCVQRLRLAPEVRKAYLARATLAGAQEPGIVLVLAAAGQPGGVLLRDLRDLAAAVLAADMPVTVLAVRPGECAAIERVCGAFYYAA